MDDAIAQQFFPAGTAEVGPSAPQASSDTASFQWDLIDRFPLLAKHQNYKPSSTRFAIVQELNCAFEANEVPRAPRDAGMINRKYLSDRLGVSIFTVRRYLDVIGDYESLLPYFAAPERGRFGSTPNRKNVLDDAARFVLEQFPSLEHHQRYPPGSTAFRLANLLNKSIFEEDVARSRKGRFNQTPIAEELGFSRSALTFYKEILADYNRCIGTWEDVFEARVPSMREWLHNHIAEGTLELRDGQVNRQQLFSDLGYPKTWSYDRYPTLRKFWDEADALVTQLGYQPAEIVQRLSLLSQKLSNDPPVGKDGFTINRIQLGRDLGWSAKTTTSMPYIAVILAAEQELRGRIEYDPLILVIEGKQYKFNALLSQGWNYPFLVDLRKSFQKFYRNRKMATPAFYAIRDVLAHISSSSSDAARALREAIQNRVPLRYLEAEWSRIGLEYRDLIRLRYRTTTTANKVLGTTNSLMRRLGTDGVFPPLMVKLRRLRVDNHGHLRSVAEVSAGRPSHSQNPHVDDYLRFATSMLSKAAAIRNVELTASEEGDFSAALRVELERREYKASENPAYVILTVIERRLEALKTEAMKIIDKARALLETGQELLEKTKSVLVDWRAKLELKGTEYQAFLEETFPIEDDRRDEGLGNLLRIVTNDFGRRLPVGRKDRGGVSFLTQRADGYGGTKLVQSYLLPSSDAVSACLTLYLLASGSNIGVGRTLDDDCLETSEEPNSTRITGFKARAKGKPIHTTLSDSSAAVRSMRWLDSATRVVRPSKGKWAKTFFICLNRNGLGELSDHIHRRRFKEMAERSPDLQGLGLTPNMLRPSILLRAALTQDGRTSLSRAIGQHSRIVNQGYTGKYPTRFLHDVTIRHFMHSMETVVVRNVEEIHEALGVSVEDFEARIEGVMATGLGVLCRDRQGRPGSEGTPCKSLDCWNDCPQLFIVAREKDMAILQIWQASLRAVEGEWMRDRPERWGEVWLPWLCFVDAVELKMRQNFSSVWRAATAMATSVMSNPNFQLMRLF
ncbi:hypothetical protein GFB56_15520 [Ensifer sp. T173]|uniref:Tyr recombinase domain-containing protein n=1 Tax=Ensifer canadensis TaxID=555315 RepID=A0AAW4FN15_9HYPH|nr:hypothetical protein [Ensifer canadensis]MBM3092215.1 hypothetical protein [Ensifer canadensis]UBI73940.1 hypothetical protein J3R84_10410 [Ensifer canadensis]